MRRRFTTGILWVAMLALGPLPIAQANPLWPGFFELTDRPYSLDIPPAGSHWESLIRDDGADSSEVLVVDQALFDDDDMNGVVSTGDRVYGPQVGEGRTAIFVAFASRLYRLAENGWVLKPVAEGATSHVGETWEILLPAYLFGETFIVEDLTGTGEPEEGDGVRLGGVFYTIQDIRLVVEAAYAVPVETTTWGRIKAWLRVRL